MNGRSIEHRAARVSLVNGLATVLGMGFQLVSVPVCFHYWGKEAYGSWLALLSAFMLLRGLDGGYTAFVGNKLNYLYHQDTARLHIHLSSAVFGIIVISLLQLGLAAGTLFFDPLAALLGMPETQPDGFVAKLGLLTLMISWTLTGSYLGIVHRLLVPSGLMYQAAWWSMGFQACQFAAIMAAAIYSLNVVETSLLFAITQLVIYVASALYVRHALPAFSPWLKGANRKVGIADLRQSSFLTISNLVQQGATNGSVLLVSALAGPVSVPIFTTVRTLTNLWTAVTTILSTPLLPDVVRIHASGEMQKLIVINQVYWVLVGSAVNFGAVLSYPLIPVLYRRWTAQTVMLDQGLLCWLLGSVVIANAGALIALHLNGINRVRIVLAASVARAVLCLGAGAIGFRRYGLASFGMGIFVGEIVATVITVRYFLKNEIAPSKKAIPISFGPMILSTGAVVLFFSGTALGWWSARWVWLLTMAGISLASVWGWNTLEASLKARLASIPRKFFAL